MIIIKLNEANFEYDIYSLFKAFFPERDVNIIVEEKEFEKKISLFLFVNYNKNSIQLALFESNADKLTIKDIFDNTYKSKSKLIKSISIDIESDKRPEVKNKLKRGIYQLLNAHTNKVLPWGTLTGIRPIKIPMAFLEQGKTEIDISLYMKDTYYLSEEKTKLSLSVAKTEMELLSKVDFLNGYSLYIGIPFCPTTCLYCSFTSYPAKMWEKEMDTYLDTLIKEIEYVAWRLKEYKLNTIYIGGGTPTTLSELQLEHLLNKIKNSFNLSYLLEFTVEAGRPDSITAEKLLVLKKYNVTRISINPQTMNQRTLDLIGRKHTIEQTIKSYHLARKLGFENINMDLIIGLLGEDTEDAIHTLKEIEILKPDSVTVHSLAIKRGSKLHERVEEKKQTKQMDLQKVMNMASDMTKSMDMVPYYLYRQKNIAGNFENIGYAKKDKAGLYNILIMEEKQSIIAVGAGAITKYVFENGTQIDRSENVKDIKTYLERIDDMIDRKRKCFEKFGYK